MRDEHKSIYLLQWLMKTFNGADQSRLERKMRITVNTIYRIVKIETITKGSSKLNEFLHEGLKITGDKMISEKK